MSRPNFNSNELAALKFLRKRDDVIVNLADKGVKVIIWSKELYFREGERQLDNNPTHCKAEDNDMNNIFKSKVKKVIYEEVSDNNLPKTAKELKIQDPRAPVFYLLLNIYKPNCPGKPIVSATNCPTFHRAGFLDRLVSPMVEQLDTYVKHTKHALQIFHMVSTWPQQRREDFQHGCLCFVYVYTSYWRIEGSEIF